MSGFTQPPLGIPLTGSPAAGQAPVATGPGAAAWTPVMVAQAATPAAGTPLVNGTPAILSWNVPNDGKLHAFAVALALNVTGGATTGGAINVNFTIAGSAKTVSIFTASKGSAGVDYGGDGTGGFFPLPCDPGTTVTVTQTALTAGTASLLGSLWGA